MPVSMLPASTRPAANGADAPTASAWRRLSTAADPPQLTQRQGEVLVLLSGGLTVQAIAHRLYLSPRTVGKHLERIYRRLGTSDRLTTVMRAQQLGLIDAV